MKDVDPEEYDDDIALAEAVFGSFLKNSADVRYFGATMSVDLDEQYGSLPDHFTGPVQFSPGKSMHAVNENEEYDSLTSVIATQEGKEQGGFGLNDHRIQYGLIRFHGLVDEHGAADTNLTEMDVARLDTLCWRAIKNQTISRSKIGQEPRLYLRVEYADESFHLGGLDKDLELDREEGRTKPDDELRSIRDLTVSIDALVAVLKITQTVSNAFISLQAMFCQFHMAAKLADLTFSMKRSKMHLERIRFTLWMYITNTRRRYPTDRDPRNARQLEQRIVRW